MGDDAPKDFSDHAQWRKMIRRGQAHQAPASFTPTHAARMGLVGAEDCTSLGALALFPLSAHEKDMFQVMGKQVGVVKETCTGVDACYWVQRGRV